MLIKLLLALALGLTSAAVLTALMAIFRVDPDATAIIFLIGVTVGWLTAVVSIVTHDMLGDA